MIKTEDLCPEKYYLVKQLFNDGSVKLSVWRGDILYGTLCSDEVILREYPGILDPPRGGDLDQLTRLYNHKF